MREIDKAFLALFKDLKIVQDKSLPTDKQGKPNYVCYIGKEIVPHREVVRMVKRYQDEIIDMLTESGLGEKL